MHGRGTAVEEPWEGLAVMALPVRRLRVCCRARRGFVLPLGDTLGPAVVLRGLIGAAITELDPGLVPRLFKLPAIPSADGSTRSEQPSSPWRLRTTHLYAREIPPDFELVVDLFGEEPIALQGALVEALRLAGSDRCYREWNDGCPRRFGIILRDEDGRFEQTLPFEVIRVEASPVLVLAEVAARRSHPWRDADAARLDMRTLTVLAEKQTRQGRGEVVAVTGWLNAAVLVAHAMRRAALLEVATRQPADRRTWPALREALESTAAAVEAVARITPLDCLDAVTVPLERRAPHPRSMRGLIGSATFAGSSLAVWVPGFTTCELAGIGQATTYGAGEVTWSPLHTAPFSWRESS